MDLVESGRYFRCSHCGTYHFPHAIEADGIRIVGRPVDAPRCPICGTGMAHAVLDDDHPIDFCATCRGLLLPRAAFAHVTSTRRAWATSPPAEPIPLNREDLARELECPKCGRLFETYPHYGPGNVVIDNCTACDLVWLDFGEMRQIVDAPGRDRGSRHVPRVDDDYVRHGPYGRDGDGEEGRADRPRGSDPLSFLLDVMFRR
jgi:Zn-finger nucleic acid-binding protein